MASEARRDSSVDTYRGFVMLLMLAEALRLAEVAKHFPGNPVWRALAYNQTHVEWTGGGLHDFIQPSFTFLAGVAIPYSLRNRVAKGQSRRQIVGHAVLRSLILIALGVLLASYWSHAVSFADTLSQIGLGYTFAVLLGFAAPRWQWTAAGCILFAYWLAWAVYPLPPADFDYASVGVPAGWHQHLLTGFAAHWNKNANLGEAFDVRFLNLFPRKTPFAYNGGGYLTLSFVPTLVTMILGVIAGQWQMLILIHKRVRKLLGTGACLMLAGLLLHYLHICPIVKRIWTPSWTLFSGGACFSCLSLFLWINQARGHEKVEFPFVVVGRNSIAAYLLAPVWEYFAQRRFYLFVGDRLFHLSGRAVEPLILGSATLLIYWFVLFWMYRHKVFLRI